MNDFSMKPTDESAIFKDVFNLADSGIMVFDWPDSAKGDIGDLRLRLANQSAQAITGLTNSTLPDQAPALLFPLLTEIGQNLRYVAQTGESYQTELLYHSTNQEKSNWYTLSVRKYDNSLVLSLTDISALKTESTLAKGLLTSSIDAIIAYEAMRDKAGTIYDLRIKVANEIAARTAGIPLERLLNSTIITELPSIVTSGLFDRYKHTIETGESQQFEFQYNFDNQDNWYEIVASKLNDGLLLTYRDITTAKRNEKDLQESIERLKQSNQSLEQFAYIASHDLQEPLRKIQSFGDLLRKQQQEKLDEASLDLVNRMQSAAQRMNILIHDLLTFSRLSWEKLPFSATNLQNVVNDVLADLDTTIRTKQAELIITSLPTIMGNPGQLHQLFQNLLSNALKFVRADIRPTVVIDCKQVTGQNIPSILGQLVTSQDKEHTFYAISITDNGIGFDSKYVDRIFAVFQRLHTRNEYPGTGVGLSIVQKVIENHQGYINVESQPGHGTTFTVYLRADTTEEPRINL